MPQSSEEPRRTWGRDVLNSRKVSIMIVQKVLSGELSLLVGQNSCKVQLPDNILTIVLKAFNNHRTDALKKTHAYFIREGENDLVINLFIFEIFSDLANWRGCSYDFLNEVLRRYMAMNNQAAIFSNLAHELEHAFEADRGLEQYEKPLQVKRNTTQQFRDYINQSHEITARIVEYTYPISTIWSSYAKSKSQIRPEDVKLEMLRILRKFKHLDDLTQENRRRFIKGVYQVLWYLFKFYTKDPTHILTKQGVKVKVESLQ